jgi:hypothetical protein
LAEEEPLDQVHAALVSVTQRLHERGPVEEFANGIVMEQDHVRTLSTLRMGMVSTQGRTAIYAACALPFNGPPPGSCILSPLRRFSLNSADRPTSRRLPQFHAFARQALQDRGLKPGQQGE